MKHLKKKQLKVCIICTGVLAVPCFILVLFARLFYPSNCYGHIANKNEMANRTAYHVSSVLLTLDLPLNEEIILSGEYRDNDYCQLVICPNDFIKSDVIIIELPQGAYKGYWSAKIQNNVVQELWYNDIEICPSQLTEYTKDQQEHSISFVNPFLHPLLFHQEGFINDSLVLGYYKVDRSGKPKWEVAAEQK